MTVPHKIISYIVFTLQIFTSLFFVVTKTFPTVDRSSFLPVFLYGIVSATVSVTEYVTVTFIPVATANSLVITVALSSGLLLFTVIVKEKMRIDKPLAVLVCIAGVLLVLQPTFLFHSSDQQNGHYPDANMTSEVNATMTRTVLTVR